MHFGNFYYWTKQMGKLPLIGLQENVFDVLYVESQFKGPQRKQKLIYYTFQYFKY